MRTDVGAQWWRQKDYYVTTRFFFGFHALGCDGFGFANSFQSLGYAERFHHELESAAGLKGAAGGESFQHECRVSRDTARLCDW